MALLQVFSTCPPSVAAGRTAETEAGSSYRARVTQVAQWSEAMGCEGILVYTDNRLVDPWLTAQLIIEVTERLSPLVAVQPAYMHPYSVAKMVATLSYFHSRKIYLNMVAGGFKRDLEALNDFKEHDERYTLLIEYSRMIKALVERSGKCLGFSYEGTYYSVDGLKLVPPCHRNSCRSFSSRGHQKLVRTQLPRSTQPPSSTRGRCMNTTRKPLRLIRSAAFA